MEVVADGAPANFPGHGPSGPGTCKAGAWVNPQGRVTSGSLDRPHPHCFLPVPTVEIMLEPISSCFTDYACKLPNQIPIGLGQSALYLVNPAVDKGFIVGTTKQDKEGNVVGASTEALGRVVGYAIDASTLGTKEPTRVGTLTFELADLASAFTNVFTQLGGESCSVDADVPATCVNDVLTAYYEPFKPEAGGVGTASKALGFLWFTPKTTPYYYADYVPK